jgi:hypothetical protein
MFQFIRHITLAFRLGQFFSLCQILILGNRSNYVYNEIWSSYGGSIKMVVFCDVTQCSLVEGTCCFAPLW